MHAASCSGCCLREASCKGFDSDSLSVYYIADWVQTCIVCLVLCAFVSPGTPCTWFMTVSRCHGWCSVTSGRALTWWTVSSHAPPRKPSSLFSWRPPPPSAWSSTWLNLPILLSKLSLGRSINHSDSQVINQLINLSII